jgi:tRNA 2-selenouridine synthase SelU
MGMLAKLERLIGEIGDINSKLVLLVGPSRSGKTQLLRQLGVKLNIEPLNVSLVLGRRLAATPNPQARLHAGAVEAAAAAWLLGAAGQRSPRDH